MSVFPVFLKLAGRRVLVVGAGPVAALPEPLELRHMTYEQIGEDVLLTAYVHEP